MGLGGYTSRMDRVRFGRALGFGARQAVKTLVAAADAAVAENPASGKTPQRSSRVSPVERAAPVGGRDGQRPANEAGVVGVGAKAGRTTGKTVVQAKEFRKGVGRGAKRFGEAVWGPFVRLSGVLWLEVTGVFFGVFALSAGMAVWRLRGDLHATAANGAGHRNLMFAMAMLAVFGYFCVSSFLRAKKRERGR